MREAHEAAEKARRETDAKAMVEHKRLMAERRAKFEKKER